MSLPFLPIPAPVPTPRHILVVDDDRELASMVSLVLLNSGYMVKCARDGEAGWEALSTDHFDLLITDHEMPRLTGLGLLRRVRGVPLAMPAIMISGSLPSDVPDFAQLLQPGVALQKPFRIGALLANVRELLHVRAAESVSWSPIGLQLAH